MSVGLPQAQSSIYSLFTHDNAIKMRHGLKGAVWGVIWLTFYLYCDTFGSITNRSVTFRSIGKIKK